MSETRDFHLGDILSITTDRLVSPEHVGGVYKILNWMTGEELMTHQLPRASRECEGPLLEQHPQLAGVVVPDFGGGDRDELELRVMAWLATQTAIYGERLPVAKLDPVEHTRIDPISELTMIRPDLPIVGVVLPEGGES
jgi:hypothetical protein